MLAICQDQIFMKICSYKSALLLGIIDHVSNFEKHLLRYLYQEVALCNGRATDRVVRWPTSKFYWLFSLSLICNNLFSFKLGHGCPLQIHGNEISIKWACSSTQHNFVGQNIHFSIQIKCYYILIFKLFK